MLSSSAVAKAIQSKIQGLSIADFSPEKKLAAKYSLVSVESLKSTTSVEALNALLQPALPGHSTKTVIVDLTATSNYAASSGKQQGWGGVETKSPSKSNHRSNYGQEKSPVKPRADAVSHADDDAWKSHRKLLKQESIQILTNKKHAYFCVGDSNSLGQLIACFITLDILIERVACQGSSFYVTVSLGTSDGTFSVCQSKVKSVPKQLPQVTLSYDAPLSFANSNVASSLPMVVYGTLQDVSSFLVDCEAVDILDVKLEGGLFYLAVTTPLFTATKFWNSSQTGVSISQTPQESLALLPKLSIQSPKVGHSSFLVLCLTDDIPKLKQSIFELESANLMIWNLFTLRVDDVPEQYAKTLKDNLKIVFGLWVHAFVEGVVVPTSEHLVVADETQVSKLKRLARTKILHVSLDTTQKYPLEYSIKMNPEYLRGNFQFPRATVAKKNIFFLGLKTACQSSVVSSRLFSNTLNLLHSHGTRLVYALSLWLEPGENPSLPVFITAYRGPLTVLMALSSAKVDKDAVQTFESISSLISRDDLFKEIAMVCHGTQLPAFMFALEKQLKTIN